MNPRLVLSILAACDISVAEANPNYVRVRIQEKLDEGMVGTDFEIEGNPQHIAETLATVANAVMSLCCGERQPPSA